MRHQHPLFDADVRLEQAIHVLLKWSSQHAPDTITRHEKIATAKTVTTLRGRLSRARTDFKDVPLADLEHMTDEIAGFVDECWRPRAARARGQAS